MKNANDKIKPIINSIIDQQSTMRETLEELDNEAQIQICNINMQNVIHVFTLQKLKILAKVFEQEILFIPFDRLQSDHTVEGYFYIGDTKVFALG